MPEPDKAPPLPRGLIVKSEFGPHRRGAHIDDPAQVRAIWTSTQRGKVAPWNGGEARKAELAEIARKADAAKPAAKVEPVAGAVA